MSRFLKTLTVENIKDIKREIFRLSEMLTNANEEKMEKLAHDHDFKESLDYLHFSLKEMEGK